MTKEKDYIDILNAWSNIIKENRSTDYEWHDTSGIYSLLGFDKVRYNKEHPHTIDLMKADGTIYYGVYPTNITTEGDDENKPVAEHNRFVITIDNLKNFITDYDSTTEVK